MLKAITIPAAVLVGCLLLTPDRAAGQEVTLARAVREFNEQAKKDPVGKDQPALTEEEAVAAIRGWIRDRFPADDPVYAAYQKIANTGALPPGAQLSFTTRWQFKDYEFDVWWVDLSVPVGKGAGYTYRLRDQKLGSRPIKK